jgi:hypothetical protein
VTATADPFENRNAALTWHFVRRRTSLAIGASWDDQSYETQTVLDRTRIGWSVSLVRHIASRLTASLEGALNDEDFDESDFTSKTRDFGASLSWQFGQSAGLELQADRSNRTTSTGLGEYTENRVFLRVYYIARRATPDGGALQ